MSKVKEVVMDIKDTPFKDYKEKEWALYFIERYGGIDGAHHKDWVLDQVSRLLHGSKVTIVLASWEDDIESEWRCNIEEGDVSQEYHNWVKDFETEEDGRSWSNYDVGITP